MKYFTLLLCLLFSFQTMAASLEEIVDDYHYAVTVDWDQKDQDQLNNINSEFRTRLAPILSSAEAKQELHNLLKRRMVDVTKEPLLKQHLAKAATFEDLVKIIQMNEKSLYQQGAKWDDEQGLIIGIVLGVMALSVLVVSMTADYCYQSSGLSMSCVYE